jgi:hypothetical protein
MMRAYFLLGVCAACSTASPDPSACGDGECADGETCTAAEDCASGVCAMEGTCAAPTCSDTVLNGTEVGVDCGGACPVLYDGVGCVAGTAGSMVCTSYTSGPKFTVTISWNAQGGNAYVDYTTAYGAMGEDYNSEGIVGGAPVNVCTTGPMSLSFDLPLGSGYTYKVWHAYCVREDACSGCGSDVTMATGGPFGVTPRC